MKKNEVIQIRVTPEEKAAIERVAKSYGLNKSDFLRLAAAKMINEREMQER